MWKSDDKPGSYTLYNGGVLQVPSKVPLMQHQLAKPSKFLEVFKLWRTWCWNWRHPGACVPDLQMYAATQ